MRRVIFAGFVLACLAHRDPLAAQTNPQLPGQFTGQLTGRIVDEAGNGIPAATVELWSAQARVGRTLSSESGVFLFRQHTGAIRLTVASIGFRSQVLELSDEVTAPVTADAAANSAIYAAALNELHSMKVVKRPITLLPYPRDSARLSDVPRRPTIHPALEPLAAIAHICRAGLASPCVVPLSSATVVEFGNLKQFEEGTRVTVFIWSRADYLAGNPAREHELWVRQQVRTTGRTQDGRTRKVANRSCEERCRFRYRGRNRRTSKLASTTEVAGNDTNKISVRRDPSSRKLASTTKIAGSDTQ